MFNRNCVCLKTYNTILDALNLQIDLFTKSGSFVLWKKNSVSEPCTRPFHEEILVRLICFN